MRIVEFEYVHSAELRSLIRLLICQQSADDFCDSFRFTVAMVTFIQATEISLLWFRPL